MLKWLLVTLVSSTLIYLALHARWPAKDTLWPPEWLVDLDSAGRVIRLSESDLRWYLGREQTTALASVLKDRTQRINELQDRVVRQALLEFQVRFSSSGDLSGEAHRQIESLGRVAAQGDFEHAARLYTAIVNGWTDETRKLVGEKSIFDLDYGLGELARLKQQQTESVGKIMQPPLMHQIFWMTPLGALAEAVFWSFFGTLVNLILNISQARARGRFKTDEVWVSVSKTIYGPILSSVLILAIYFGMLNVGAEVRFWFLPLVGFLFGYNTRKLAVVIDILSDKLLGAASKSARQVGEMQAQAATNAAAAIQTAARPRTFSELKQQVPVVVETATVSAVINQQSKR